jgi:hypothetical protein
MLPHTQQQWDDQYPFRPSHHVFLGDEAGIPQPVHMSDNSTINLTGHDSARMIGVLNNNYNGPISQYYNNHTSTNSPVLEWLWPQHPDSHNPATASYAKQNIIHDSALEARRRQSEPWLMKRSNFKDWFAGTGGSLWIYGKGNVALSISIRDPKMNSWLWKDSTFLCDCQVYRVESCTA